MASHPKNKSRDWQEGVVEAEWEELPALTLTIPFPGAMPRQRGPNTAHLSIELRAHCNRREMAYIKETADLLDLPRATLVRWFTIYGCRAVRKYLDGQDRDPNPT